jgi:hypothetical protein
MMAVSKNGDLARNIEFALVISSRSDYMINSNSKGHYV